jgi:glycosyltransferase involved in cell wall biosynthesis
MHVFVVSTSERGEKITRPLRAVDINCIQFTIQSIKDTPNLLKQIQRENPDIIIVDSLSFAGGTVALAKAIFSIPYVIRIRGDAMSEHRSLFRRHLSRGSYGRAAKQLPRYAATKLSLEMTENYLFVSDYVKQVYNKTGMSAQVINTPCFMLESNFEYSSDNSLVGFEPNQTVILAVTNMNYLPKVEGLLQALDPLSEVLETEPETTMVIAGDGPYFEKIEKEVEDLPGSIITLGYVDEIEPLYDRADIFVHFSLLDAYPSTVLEAYASRTPVVANDAVGMSEQIIDGETGYLVDIEDSESIQRIVRSLISSPKKRKALGNRGYEYATDNNSLEEIGQQFESYLTQLLYE